MARVPEAEVARVKREVDLVELVGRSGVALSRRGEDLVGLCPFHEDREPSLVVSPADKVPATFHAGGRDRAHREPAGAYRSAGRAADCADARPGGRARRGGTARP